MMSSAKPTVFIVDDDISIRESLDLLVQSLGWNAVTFSSATEFLAIPKPSCACCLLLDVNLPDLNGLDLQLRISADQAIMPIIFITGYGDIPMSVRAMKAGAAEFLTKPFREEVLLAAIRHALDRSRMALDEETSFNALRDRYMALSVRERQVMDLVVSGLLNKQIGGQLGISEITVKAHRGRVMQKMQAHSLAELVKLAARLRPASAPDA